MALSRTLAGYVLLVVTALGWAGAWITARAAAHDAPALTVTVGRFAVAALALLPVWFVVERGRRFEPTRQEWGLLVAMSLTGTILYTVLFLNGVKFAPASDGAVLVPALAGITAMGLSAALARAVPPRRALLGAGLAFAGVLLVGWSSIAAAGLGSERALGDLLFVGSAATWAVYTVLGKRASQRVPAVTSILLVSAMGAIFLAPVALVLEGVPDFSTWSDAAVFNVLYLGLGATAVAFVTFYVAVRLVGVDRTAPALGLIPVFGVLGSWLILGESLTALHAVGGALVVAGIVVPAVKLRGPASKPAEPLAARMR